MKQKKNILQYINECFENETIPNELSYEVEPSTGKIDYDKFNYNLNKFDIVASKFPNGWDSIPGFDKVIENLSNEISWTMLDEMNYKSKA
jgi:hypothetical protein